MRPAARGQAESDGIHQELEPREAPRVGQVEFGNLVCFNLFDRVQNTDLFIARPIRPGL
jgi:hypothetical protein